MQFYYFSSTLFPLAEIKAQGTWSQMSEHIKYLVKCGLVFHIPHSCFYLGRNQ